MKKNVLMVLAVAAFGVAAIYGLRALDRSVVTKTEPAPALIHDPNTINIGYFHGGRTIILYRTMVYREFEKEGLHVNLMTKYLNEDTWFPMPDLTASGHHRTKSIGKATGDELVAKVVDGTFDGATIGETAFIKAVRNKSPIVAVAELGHDVRGGAGHALVLHKDVKLSGPKSYHGLKFGARRSSGGDEVVLREFLVQQGVDPDKDVKLITNVSDDVFGSMFATRELDGGYGHVMSVKKWIEKYRYPVKIHRALNWIDPELSQSVLIFSRTFVEEHPDKVLKALRAYRRRVHHEFHMPESEKVTDNVKGLQISMDFAGLNLPEHREIPTIRIDMLNTWQKLLVKHKALDQIVDLRPYVDNTYVEQVSKEKL